MYKNIINPITGKLININRKLGRQILNNYLIQLGGHNDPCGLNSKTGRCKKSSSWDNANCKLVNGRCKNKSLTTTKKQHIRETNSTSSKQNKKEKIKSRIGDRKKKIETKQVTKKASSINCNIYKNNKGKSCPDCCSAHYDVCKWVIGQPKGKGCHNKDSQKIINNSISKKTTTKLKQRIDNLPLSTNETRLYPKLSTREVNQLIKSLDIYLKNYATYGGHILSKKKKRVKKSEYLKKKNTQITIQKCKNHKLPDMPKLGENYKMISILGPVGLDYIQYKNTEIFLLPEKHQFGIDEDRIKRFVKYDKYHIPIIEIYKAITNSNLCVDIYHEDLRFREKILQGGGELQYQNLEDDGGEYAYSSYHSIIDNYDYGRYAYNWDSKPDHLKNTFFHYGEFRSSKSSTNFAIWNLLQEFDNWSGTGLNLNALNTLRLNYLSTPRIIAKLAEAYCLRDDFEAAISEIFPRKIMDMLFDFKALKYYNNNWMHPIRKEIVECPHREKLERFIKRHIDGVKNKDTFANSINWYFEQPGRNVGVLHYLDVLNDNINLTNFFNSLYIDEKTKETLKTNFVNTHIRLLYETSLYLGDFLTDLYDLSRLLRYIEHRNTNIVLYYGGWAHPWTVRKYFLEELSNSRDIKVHKSYGRFTLRGNFWGHEWEDQNNKINRESYSFEMPYKDFETLFVRSQNGNTIMDIKNNTLITNYNNPKQKQLGRTMSGDWDLFRLVGEDKLTYPKNDKNMGFKVSSDQ